MLIIYDNNVKQMIEGNHNYGELSRSIHINFMNEAKRFNRLIRFPIPSCFNFHTRVCNSWIKKGHL